MYIWNELWEYKIRYKNLSTYLSLNKWAILNHYLIGNNVQLTEPTNQILDSRTKG